MLRAKAAKAKAKATAKAAVGEADKDRAGGQNTNKGLTDKGRATSVSEQVYLNAPQLVRLHGDPKLCQHDRRSQLPVFAEEGGQ